MARKPSDGRKATGIQSKKGKLFIIINEGVVENGKLVNKHRWVSTSLDSTPENIKKAVDLRERLLKHRSQNIINSRIKMAEYIDTFLVSKERTVANTTYAGYCRRCQPIKEFFYNTCVRDITTVRIEQFLDYLSSSGRYGLRSLKDIKVMFNSIMQNAVKDGLILANPVEDATFSKSILEKKVKADGNEDNFFTYQEGKRFLDIVKDHELYEYFYMTLFFGLRREEALGLKWSAINFRSKEFIINHTVTKGTQVNRLNTTKTDSSKRIYPLTDEQIKMLKMLKNKETANRKLFGNAYVESDYIFKHEDGSLYYPDYPSKAFRKMIKRHPELPQEITLHGLRVSCASILIHEGYDIKAIQNWLGHADITTTLKIYVKIKNRESKKEISAGMDTIIPLKL